MGAQLEQVAEAESLEQPRILEPGPILLHDVCEFVGEHPQALPGVLAVPTVLALLAAAENYVRPTV